MGTFVAKLLANGQLDTTKAALYTVGSGKQTVIKKITLVNTDTVDRTVNLYLCASGGTSRRIIPQNLVLEPGCLLEEEDILLTAAQKLEGDSSAASVIDYTVQGVEETV